MIFFKRFDEEMQQRFPSPSAAQDVADLLTENDSKMIANNGVNRAEKAYLDGNHEFKLPWWGWLCVATALTAALIYLMD